MTSVDEFHHFHRAASGQRSTSERTHKDAGIPPRTPDASIEYVDVASLRPHPGNPRLHSKKQSKKPVTDPWQLDCPVSSFKPPTNRVH